MRLNTNSQNGTRRLRLPKTGESARAAGQRRLSQRARGKSLRAGHINERLPFSPPEDWHEPRDRDGYRIVVREPGVGYRHILTPQEVRDRLAQLPAHFSEPLEIVQFSQMTRKKQSFPCYGMQWGSSLYLYPLEDNLVERYTRPPKPNQVNEARMYGGRWTQDSSGFWTLAWTEQAIKDFYLNNILIHELGHLLDDRNTRSLDRERYAEWFAVRYGYTPTRGSRNVDRGPALRRHG